MVSGRAKLFRYLLRLFAALVFLITLTYLADSFSFLFRSPQYRSVRVTPYYAVPRKDHKIEYMFQDPSDETCVNSLFPRRGDMPCWYLTKHRERRIDL